MFILYEEIKSAEHKIIRHMFRFSQISLNLPLDDTPNEPIMTPQIARVKTLTYSNKLMTNVDQVLEIMETQS